MSFRCSACGQEHDGSHTAEDCPEAPRTNDRDRGLFKKFTVLKDGEEQDGCFVLEPEDDVAAQQALLTYASVTDDEELTDDLREWVNDVRDPERGPRV